MKRKMFLNSLVIMLIISLAIAGSAFTATPDKPIRLRLAHPWPTTSLLHNEQLEPWAKMVNQRTSGRVIIDIFPAGTLAKGADIFDGIKSGLFEIGHDYSGYYKGRLQLSTILNVPFLGGKSAEEASLVLWALYNKFPQMRAEYSWVKILTLHSCPAQNLLMAKKPIRQLEDCKGLRLRVPAAAASLAKMLGFAPIVMSNAETYESMQKGVADGCFNSWETVKSFRLDEVTKYVTEANIYWGPFFVAMNIEAWNNLPPDVQKVFEELGGEWFAQFCGKANDVVNIQGKKLFESKPGKETITLSSAELAKFTKATKPLVHQWVSDLEGKGLPGCAVLEEAVILFKK